MATEKKQKEMRYWWGGVYRSMVTLFMTISGGCDWEAPLLPLRTLSPLYEYMFLFYIFFMCFGVLNVGVGAFVATTTAIAETDKEAIVQCTMQEIDGYTGKIKEFFKEADLDRSAMTLPDVVSNPPMAMPQSYLPLRAEVIPSSQF